MSCIRYSFSALCTIVWLLAASLAAAQSPPDPDYVRQTLFASYADFKNELLSTVNIVDPAQRQFELDLLWATLQNAGQVPYAQDNQVAFLVRSSASTVAWPGDFNGWNPNASGWQGMQFAGTDLWILEKSFPSDARLDYKVFDNGNWLLDPANSLQMWGGFGPNSELRMPDYIFPQETVRQTGVPLGNLTGSITTSSTNLGAPVNYRVYTPAGYDSEQLTNLPAVYVTDGHEYSADHLGSTVIVLDNLIDSGVLQPTLAVFIDPRHPTTGQNQRFDQYTGNPAFVSFVADELVPEIDSAYRTLDAATGRTILGTSLGGVNSAYFGGTRSDVFENIAAQSPSNFSSIFHLYGSQSLQDDVDLFVTAGTIGDGSGGVNFTNLLAANGYDFEFTQVNEGHSWGNWRALLDEMLTHLIGATPALAADFDDDLLVAQNDLALWQVGFGSLSGAAHRDGDSDSDRDVDGRDFLIWQQQNSVGIGALAKPQTVPEPTSSVLLFCAAVVLALVSGRD
ncbi:MAG: alpha/beta hydrolase-fold protein [Aeoliella sp.]